MADAADIVDALDGPAAVVNAAGLAVHANAAFLALPPPMTARVRALAADARMETPGPDGTEIIWRARDIGGGERLLIGREGAQGRTARDRFLASLSHELRTPLNGIMGMAGLLEGGRLAADQRAYVAGLKESGEHLLSLVNDVLDLAKLEAGKLDLEPAPVSLSRVLRAVCELLSPRAYAKGLEIAWAVPPDLPPVEADEGRIRQILFNLAGNGVKFTQSGGVLLTVESFGAGPGRVRLRFCVSDTGPGVPEVARERIFEEFAHADHSHGSRPEGAGLGLAIVRRLAAAHGGSVGLKSTPGHGSTFWFEAEFKTSGPASHARPLDGRTVAVVSPNLIVREAAARLIEAAGGLACACRTPEEAAQDAPAGEPVLIDHALLVSESTHRRLRPLAGRPCIVLLAPEERAHIPRYRAAGFCGYLIKPLRLTSLIERVLAATGAAAPADPVREDERVAPALASGVRVLLAEDNAVGAFLARSLLEREGCSVDRVSNGDEAVAAASGGVYDLVLMDVRMPGLDGREASQVLRAQGVKTPIVALTADVFEDDRHACLAAGMDDFLAKPLDLAALRSVLARWTGPDWTRERARAKLAS